jgi:hypothetical protein
MAQRSGSADGDNGRGPLAGIRRSELFRCPVSMHHPGSAGILLHADATADRRLALPRIESHDGLVGRTASVSRDTGLNPNKNLNRTKKIPPTNSPPREARPRNRLPIPSQVYSLQSLYPLTLHPFTLDGEGRIGL